MAFRATQKTPVKKKEASTKTVDTAVVSESSVPPPADLSTKPFSVEDLVGAPVTEDRKTVRQEDGKTGKTEEVKVEQIITPEAPLVPNYQPSVRPQSSGYQSSGRPARFSGEYRRPGGYRRDFRPFNGNGGNNRSFDRGDVSVPRYDRPDAGSPRSYPNEVGFTSDVDVPTETVRGILDIMPEGHGFLRPKFTPSDRDIYISQSQIRRFLLRNGDMVEGQARQPKDNERYWGLLKVEKINEHPAELMERRPKFEDLTPVYPNKQLRLETGQNPFSTRIIDLVAPIGFGQRGLIVSPPKAGKTTIIKELAAGIAANYPEVHLMAALIGERPEEVTDISRSVKGEVLASNFDESPAEQTRIAEVALDRAKRLVEMGKDVVILLDSITRLARAYNLVVNPSGRTLSGGFDPAALYPAKKFLGAARCVEAQLSAFSSQPSENAEDLGKTKRITEGGSLTVIGTALVETGSRMDDLIYEEFKGTGNMELHLSRILQERRVFPAIDIGKSGTRHDELLMGEETMKKVITLRHMLSLLGDEERTTMLIERLGKTKDNAEFLESLAKG